MSNDHERLRIYRGDDLSAFDKARHPLVRFPSERHASGFAPAAPHVSCDPRRPSAAAVSAMRRDTLAWAVATAESIANDDDGPRSDIALKLTNLDVAIADLNPLRRIGWLHLAGARLGDGLGPMITQVIRLSPHLRRLSLSGNAMGPRGAADLAEGLRTAHRLLELDVSLNPIGDAGLVAIVDGVLSMGPSDTKLAQLGVATCGLSSAAGIHLARLLRERPTMRALLAWRNGLGNARPEVTSGAGHILSELATAPHMQLVQLAYNNIREVECARHCKDIEIHRRQSMMRRQRESAARAGRGDTPKGEQSGAEQLSALQSVPDAQTLGEVVIEVAIEVGRASSSPRSKPRLVLDGNGISAGTLRRLALHYDVATNVSLDDAVNQPRRWDFVVGQPPHRSGEYSDEEASTRVDIYLLRKYTQTAFYQNAKRQCMVTLRNESLADVEHYEEERQMMSQEWKERAAARAAAAAAERQDEAARETDAMQRVPSRDHEHSCSVEATSSGAGAAVVAETPDSHAAVDASIGKIPVPVLEQTRTEVHAPPVVAPQAAPPVIAPTSVPTREKEDSQAALRTAYSRAFEAEDETEEAEEVGSLDDEIWDRTKGDDTGEWLLLTAINEDMALQQREAEAAAMQQRMDEKMMSVREHLQARRVQRDEALAFSTDRRQPLEASNSSAARPSSKQSTQSAASPKGDHDGSSVHDPSSPHVTQAMTSPTSVVAHSEDASVITNDNAQWVTRCEEITSQWDELRSLCEVGSPSEEELAAIERAKEKLFSLKRSATQYCQQRFEAGKKLVLDDVGKSSAETLLEALIRETDIPPGNTDLVYAIINFTTLDIPTAMNELGLAAMAACDGSLSYLSALLPHVGENFDAQEFAAACFYNQSCRIALSLVLFNSSTIPLAECVDDLAPMVGELFADIASERRVIPREQRKGKMELLCALWKHPLFTINPNDEGPDGQTIFTRALFEGDVPVTKLILEKAETVRPSVGVLRRDGTTPLMQAVLGDKPEIVEMLLQCFGEDLDLNKVGAHGNCLDLAVELKRNPRIVTLLQERGVKRSGAKPVVPKAGAPRKIPAKAAPKAAAKAPAKAPSKVKAPPVAGKR